MSHKKNPNLFIVILTVVFLQPFLNSCNSFQKDPVNSNIQAKDDITNIEDKKFELIWSEEFDGDELNESNWTILIGDGCPDLCGWGNSELQYYRSENITVSNGLLTITAKKEASGNRDFTSSRIKTDAKVMINYGRIDVRARLPKGKGIWPAIWMLGQTRDSVGWPSCGEIDIMELRGSTPNKVGGTLHYQNSDNHHQNSGAQSYILESGDFSDDFHVFSLAWDENQMIWYVDDIPFNKVILKDLNTTEEANPFLKDFYFLLNLAVGGHYDGNPDETTVFPQTMEVDYIRVYE